MYLEPNSRKEEGQLVLLDSIVTVPEVMVQWNKTHHSVMMSIYKGRLVARQTGEGKVWLIARQSVVDLWGEPEGEVKS